MRAWGYSKGGWGVRDIRIVDARGSTPICSTRNLADQRLQGFFTLIFQPIRVCKSCIESLENSSRVL